MDECTTYGLDHAGVDNDIDGMIHLLVNISPDRVAAHEASVYNPTTPGVTRKDGLVIRDNERARGPPRLEAAGRDAVALLRQLEVPVYLSEDECRDASSWREAGTAATRLHNAVTGNPVDEIRVLVKLGFVVLTWG